MSFDTVTFKDGWHYSVAQDESGNDVLGSKLVLEDDGSYREATDEDTQSWNERKHQRFVTLEMEDGTTVRVTPDEMDAIRLLLAERRG